MTPAEKRYYKMHYASQRNALTDLYDLINSSDVYDEVLLKAGLPENVSDKLKVYKVRLYDRILKSLTSYSAKKNVLSKIRLGLEEVEVLMTKQLYDLAADHLQKIKKLCRHYEEYTYLIEISYLEFRLLNISMDKIGISKHPVFKEMGYYIDMLRRQVNLSQLGQKVNDFNKVHHFQEIKPDQRQWLEDILQQELPAIAGEQPSFRARLSRNIILAIIYLSLGEKELEYEARKRNLTLFDNHPHFKESLSFNYLAVLRNYMNFCLKHRKFDEVRKVVDEVRFFIPEKTPQEEPQLIYFYYAELQMLYENGQFDRIVKDYSDFIDRFCRKNNISGERISVITYVYLILSEMFENNHHKAQYFLRVINSAEKEVKEYFEEFFILLDLISHYEAQDYHTLSTQIQRLRRKFDITEEPQNFFQSMLSWLDRLIRFPDQKAIIAREMKTECHARFTEDKDMHSFVHYHLDYWCGALTKNTSLREEMKLMLKN